MPFGGAGPLHAAALARELGMRRILVPRASGVLCALGLAAAAPRRDAARTVMLAGESLDAERLAAERAALVTRACAELGETAARVAVRYELRYRGQSFELAVEADDGTPPGPDALREAFARAHEQRYGYRDDGVEVELVTIRVSAWGAAPRLRLASAEGEPAPGTAIEGPTVCALPGSTLYVPAAGGARSMTTAPCTCTTKELANEPSTRSNCRCSPARCAPPARRWAPR